MMPDSRWVDVLGGIWAMRWGKLVLSTFIILVIPLLFVFLLKTLGIIDAITETPKMLIGLDVFVVLCLLGTMFLMAVADASHRKDRGLIRKGVMPIEQGTPTSVEGKTLRLFNYGVVAFVIVLGLLVESFVLFTLVQDYLLPLKDYVSTGQFSMADITQETLLNIMIGTTLVFFAFLFPIMIFLLIVSFWKNAERVQETKESKE